MRRSGFAGISGILASLGYLSRASLLTYGDKLTENCDLPASPLLSIGLFAPARNPTKTIAKG